ncbi:hypothetical protein D9615_004332 [Tricholomella constricta]|uniref:Uncharacterized protein n=1 Tax=Tricholomella constricta TaxID=117010 RepID=A0A8H5M648_9AGAR|nr:hypothetical protein D9615_004332 [Tricholomella constricta]
MNHNSPPLETLDYPPSSSMSEGDSLSDSDWLDISSNRESDDNDSVMSGDSDRNDVGFMPLSRRSSMSIGSSRDGDVEAWEGFVDDSSDEDARHIVPRLAISEAAAVTDESVMGAMGALELTIGAEQDLVEEQRVKEGLDQSLISTLSASRSSTASTHTSLRDLRLSFPDPLTSSRDELNRSYEDVSPSETTFSATDVPTDDAAIAEFPDAPICKEDPGSLSIQPEVTGHTVKAHLEDTETEFEVVLYGSSSSIKWSFVQDVVRKAVLVSSLTLTDVTSSTDEPTRYLHLQPTTGGVSSVSHCIPVHDRTDDAKTVDAPTLQEIVKRPSLAVLYLPAAIHALPDHTLYLPVLIPSTSPTADSWSRATATSDWNTLSIPTNKIARLGVDSAAPIFDSMDISKVQHMRAHRLFQRLLSEAKKRQVKSLADHLSPVHAVTLFALMSLIVGFAMNTAFRRSSTPSPTTTTATPATTFWGMFGPEVNHTSIFTTTSTPAVTTNKEFSLSIFNPGTTSLSITSNDQQPVASTSATPQVDGGHCRPSMSWTDKAKSATDVIVRPGTQLSVETKPSMTMLPSSLRFDGPSGSKSLSVVVNSLSEVLDLRVSRLRNDLDELVESLDELSRAIRRQTKKRVDLSKGKAKEIRERVQYRHDRARGKAKELRKKGEEIIYAAGEQFIGRTNIARKKARDISINVANSQTWLTYQKVHAEWVARLKEKGGQGGQARRRKEGKCRMTGQTTSATTFFSWSYAELYLA